MHGTQSLCHTTHRVDVHVAGELPSFLLGEECRYDRIEVVPLVPVGDDIYLLPLALSHQQHVVVQRRLVCPTRGRRAKRAGAFRYPKTTRLRTYL